MTRPSYREALRHLWLRGVDGMQVFNPLIPGYEPMAAYEVIDAGIVYNEMLAYWHFLEEGTPMNLDIPPPHAPSVLWSGLRFRAEAIIRAVHLGEKNATFTVEPWKGHVFKLSAPPEGKTFYLVHPDMNPTLEENEERTRKRGRPGSKR